MHDVSPAGLRVAVTSRDHRPGTLINITLALEDLPPLSADLIVQYIEPSGEGTLLGCRFSPMPGAAWAEYLRSGPDSPRARRSVPSDAPPEPAPL